MKSGSTSALGGDQSWSLAPPSDDHDCGWKQHAEGLSAKLDAVLSELQALKRQVHGKKSERSKSSKMPAPVV